MEAAEKSEPKVQFTEAELATIEFRPGDTAVLMFAHRMTMDESRQIVELWKSVRPDIRCIVLEDGARLGVIRAVE